jgi:hypothetical protein
MLMKQTSLQILLAANQFITKEPQNKVAMKKSLFTVFIKDQNDYLLKVL